MDMIGHMGGGDEASVHQELYDRRVTLQLSYLEGFYLPVHLAVMEDHSCPELPQQLTC